MNEIIGTANCLNESCKKPVPVKQQRNNYAVMSCAWCGCLVQAHGAKADKFLRSRMTAETNTAEAAAERTPAPAEEKKIDPPLPEQEPTIFDVFTKKKPGAAHAAK